MSHNGPKRRRYAYSYTAADTGATEISFPLPQTEALHRRSRSSLEARFGSSGGQALGRRARYVARGERGRLVTSSDTSWERKAPRVCAPQAPEVTSCSARSYITWKESSAVYRAVSSFTLPETGDAARAGRCMTFVCLPVAQDGVRYELFFRDVLVEQLGHSFKGLNSKLGCLREKGRGTRQ